MSRNCDCELDNESGLYWDEGAAAETAATGAARLDNDSSLMTGPTFVFDRVDLTAVPDHLHKRGSSSSSAPIASKTTTTALNLSLLLEQHPYAEGGGVGGGTTITMGDEGLKRVASSFYFSAHGGDSVADLLSLLDEVQQWQDGPDRTIRSQASDLEESYDPRGPAHHHRLGLELLHHRDVLLHVLSFLDLDSLASVSEINRLCNKECGVYLNLKVQSVLKEAPNSTPSTTVVPTPAASDPACLIPTLGLDSLKQLAQLDPSRLDALVDDYRCAAAGQRRPSRHNKFDAAASLRSVLAQLRLALQDSRSRLSPFPDVPHHHSHSYTQAQMGAAAATLFVAFLSAATMAASGGNFPAFATSDEAGMLATFASHVPPLNEHGEEILRKLFGMGCLGSLMQAAKTARERRSRTTVSPSEADAAVATAPEVPARAGGNSMHSSLLAKYLQAAFDTATASWKSQAATTLPGILEEVEKLEVVAAEDTPVNPLACHESLPPATGCVGSYRRLLCGCEASVRAAILQVRKDRFEALSVDERCLASASFMEACAHDDVEAVRRILPHMDAMGFFASPDGSTTCGLHMAAFHDSCRVLSFLLTDGCCPVNSCDANGWTALHFAAGADASNAAQLLLQKFGADDSLEAANGYTPLQWAVRLQNHPVAQVLREHRSCKMGESDLSAAAAASLPVPLAAMAARFWAAFGPPEVAAPN